jgi:transposase
VIRRFDLIRHPSQPLPEVIGIDEFKGNAGRDKYQCILTDVKNGAVLDILPTRYKDELFSYFKDINRSETTHFVSDMWETYEDVSKTFFKNATYVIDKYHYYRQVFWAFEAVRKQEQKRLCKENRLLFKHSKKLLTKRYEYLSIGDKQTVDYILYLSDPLLHAHNLKEEFYKVIDCTDRESAKKALSNWILYAQNSEIPRFIDCANTFINWSEGILNSFTCPYTNGFTEGCNNKIKVLKRTAYGYRNFERFRNRILHIFNNQNQPGKPQNSSAV